MKTQEEEIARAGAAREVLENPLYIEAFAVTRTEIERQWRTSPAGDTNGREQLWQLQKLLERLQNHLQQTLISGRLARQQLQLKETMLERARRFVG